MAEEVKDLEVGISIVAKVYLHILGNQFPTPFEIRNILSIDDSELGTVVTYNYHNERYIVSDSKEEIEKAIKNAEFYRDEGLKYIESLLD